MLTHTRDPKELDDWLVKIGWGLFLLGLGTSWLLDNITPLDLEGLPMLWGGLLLLGLNAARFLLKVRMSGFTLGIGAILVVLGLGDLAHVDIPFVPVLLICIGIGMILRGLLGQGMFKRRDDDYAVDEPRYMS